MFSMEQTILPAPAVVAHPYQIARLPYQTSPYRTSPVPLSIQVAFRYEVQVPYHIIIHMATEHGDSTKMYDRLLVG